MTEDVEKLTQAQAKELRQRAMEIAYGDPAAGVGTGEEKYWGAPIWGYGRAIDELTAKPGEKLHCRECGWWRDWEVREHGKLRKVSWRCGHAEAREGFCPKEGGDKE